MTATVLLAVRNLRLGRGDLRGAGRLAGLILILNFVVWFVAGHHSLSFIGEILQVISVFGLAGYHATLLVLFYLGMEPALRRRWPWRITAWNRVLDGRFRDPLVGRDLLIGAAVGVAVGVVMQLGRFAFEWLGLPPPPPQTGAGPGWGYDPGPPTLLYYVLVNMFFGPFIAIYLMMLAFLWFLILRREWLSWAAFGLFAVLMFFMVYKGPTLAANALTLLWAAPIVGLIVFVMRRFGLLAFAAYVVCGALLSLSPLTTDVSAWYFGRGLAAALAVAALAAYGFWTATVGQRWFTEGFFGEE
jgi:serine/threonine-protein kinase